ncbi:MAG: T9SS type A sorting domain-containing protein, partial [Calditrichaeota bacterium]|nr:T9SS type A sorting domain-containing protein [Calditrichota bacterium]
FGTVHLNDGRSRVVAFDREGNLGGGFGFDSPIELTVNLPIAFSPDDSLFYFTERGRDIYEYYRDDFEVTQHWSVRQPGEENNPLGMTWNRLDPDGMPLYVTDRIGPNGQGRSTIRLIKTDPVTHRSIVWGQLMTDDPAIGTNGITVIADPRYDRNHMLLAYIKNYSGRDSIRVVEIGPQVAFLRGRGLSILQSIVPPDSTRHIAMNFDARNWPEAAYRFAVRIQHNALGPDVLIPVTFVVDRNSRVEDVDLLPVEFGIERLFPNPFNAGLQLAINLPDASDATLRLYDITGREIDVLWTGRGAGRIQIAYQGGHLASGIYLVALESAGRSDRRKVLLIR